MKSLLKHAPMLFARRASSQECLLDRPSESVSAVRQEVAKNKFQTTTTEIKRCLEEGKFQSVVDTLRELSPEFVRRCLDSFPFRVMNRRLPKSFAVWEMLLMKLHSNEEGCTPEFPYAACDELVLQIGQLLERASSMPRDNADLIHACKRVLKKVYMQYNTVLQPLFKESDRIERALYSLSLHLPIGTDRSAVSLHTAIRDEIEACVADYQDSLERIAAIEEKESQQLSQMLTEIHQNGTVPNGVAPVIEIHAPHPTQLQLQERLYSNQCIMRALEPNQRRGNLTQLVEMLKSRIASDKEVIALFGSIRSRNKFLSNNDSVEPWLKKYQRAVGRSLAVLKDIEKEMQPSVGQRGPSPTEAELSSSLEDGGQDFLTVPVLQLRTDEHYFPSGALSARRASAAIPVLFNIGEKVGEEEDVDKMARRNSVPPPSNQQRPRSTSPMKFLRASHGTNGVTRSGAGRVAENGSCKSLSSSRSSSRSLNGRETSSSIHDLNHTSELQFPAQAFRRAQSLKAKGRFAVSPITTQPPLLQVLPAGRKKSESHRQSSSNLAISSTGGGESKPSKFKNLFRSGSGGLVARCDTQQQLQREDVGSSDLLQELEGKNKELHIRNIMIQDLQRNMKELTDRLSEQAQRQLQDSERFEDISLGVSRATVVIQRYEELYSQARMEALDAIEAMQIRSSHSQQGTTAAMDASDTFNVQLLLEVFKTAYQCAWCHLQQLHSSWRGLLGVPAPTREPTPDKEQLVNKDRREEEGEGEETEEEGVGQVCNQTAEKQLESAITVYLRRVCSQQDMAPITKMVESELDARYSDHAVFAEVRGLAPFADYMEECVKVAWGLCIQTPHMTIDCSETVYNQEHHRRFYSADKRQRDIVMYMWPVLYQFSGPVLVRGTVLT